MSVWADIHKRSNGEFVRKEDVDEEIVSSLDRIVSEIDTRNVSSLDLNVSTVDKNGTVFTDIVHCHLVMAGKFSSPSPKKTLKINWNINRIKSAIGNRKFISLSVMKKYWYNERLG